MLDKYSTAIAYQPDPGRIVIRYEDGGERSHQVASMGLIGSLDENGDPSTSFADDIYEQFTDKTAVHKILEQASGARNDLIYADDNGFLTGPFEMAPQLYGLSQLAMAILWATIDMWEHKEEEIQLVNIILKTTHELAEGAKQTKG